MIVITGRIYVDLAKVAELYAQLKILADQVRSEDGCLFYHMAMEDAEAGIILAAEGWRDQAALDTHLALPAIVKLFSDFAGTFRTDAYFHQVSDSQHVTM